MTLVQKPAPDFSTDGVIDGDFKSIQLNDYKGKWLVLFFYPLDFTFVCPTEITAFSDRMEDFKAVGAEVLGCSVDSKFSHLAWLDLPRDKGGLGKLNYPLLADMNKKIASDYGVLLPNGIALRGLFVINPEGNVVYQVVHDLNVGRSVDETLRVIKAFQFSEKSGEVCPANWNDGKDTIVPDPQKSQDYFSKNG
jgi:peroxiredoxin 3